MVVDRDGELKLLVSFDATDIQIAGDLAYLLADHERERAN